MPVCTVVADVILIVSILLFCKIVFKFKLCSDVLKSYNLLLAIVCVIGVSIGTNLWNNIVAETIAYFILVVLLALRIFDDKKGVIIISSIWTVIIMEMLDTMSVVIINIINEITKQLNVDFLRVVRALILLLFVLVIGKLYNRNYNRGINTIGIKNLIAFTILTFVDTFIVMVISYIVISENEMVHQKSYCFALISVILGLFIQLGAVILLLMQRNIYKESQQLTEKYLEEQKGHYQYLEQRETETKKFRHDLRDHMGLLSVMAKEHKYDEFDKYVDKINIKIDSFGNNVTVQNGIVDAIINKYYSEAVANGVNMEVKGRFPSDCEIDAYDLCTIFSNVLSNALEATVESKDRWMSVDCRYTEDNIIIVVKNSFDNTNQLRTGKARTYKKDINNHGFGLENVRDSIKKYNGMLDIDIHENIYSITISFNYDRLEGKYEDSNN